MLNSTETHNDNQKSNPQILKFYHDLELFVGSLIYLLHSSYTE